MAAAVAQLFAGGPTLAAAATHYEQPPCAADEVQGEVLGASGYVCAPRCSEDSYNCPTDVPGDASAQPQCMLQDINRRALCGLLCQVDAQCPSGSQCKQLKQAEVGICLYPISFADWARQANIQKLAVGWPTRPASQGGVPSFQISKTYAALQSLKSKYSIDDGDADMLVLKEMLSSLKPAAGGGGGGGGAGSPPRTVGGGNAGPAWVPHDVNQLEGYVAQGLPGLGREVHDTAWNIEHFGTYRAAQNLLSGVFWFFGLYLCIGGFLKYQQGARGWDMVPHGGFWAEYPRLVADGMTYSMILLGFQQPDTGLSGGVKGGAGAFETL